MSTAGSDQDSMCSVGVIGKVATYFCVRPQIHALFIVAVPALYSKMRSVYATSGTVTNSDAPASPAASIVLLYLGARDADGWGVRTSKYS